MSTIVLLIVLWQAGTSPAVEAYVMPDQETCGKLAASFIQAEEASNADNPVAFQDYYVVSCELKNDSPVESP